MAKRSTNLNRGHRGITSDGLTALCVELGIDSHELAQGVADALEERRAACTWRVCWKKSAGDAWTEEPKVSRQDAIARKYALRDRRYIVIVQTKHADGTWIDA